MLTRLEATLNPTATIALVNQTLSANQVAFSLTRPGLPWVTLHTQLLANVDAADALAARLVASGAFATVTPAYTAEPDLKPGGQSLEGSGWLARERFLPAWNAKKTASKIPVRCADAFINTQPPSQLSHLTFRDPTPPFAGSNSNGAFNGNHGFWTMGILGAIVDTIVPTGTSPDPETLLDLKCTQSGGFTFRDMMVRLSETFPETGPFVINTSIGYKRTRTVRTSVAQAAGDALLWRKLLAPVSNRVIHASSSGNSATLGNPSSNFGSPFHTQARFADLFAVIPEGERPVHQAYFDALLAQDAGLAAVRGTLLVVGSSDEDGDKSTFSQVPADVRMIGENVSGACVTDDSLCTSNIMFANGTSATAPQIAGLAAYLWSFNPAAPATLIKKVIVDAFDGRWVDAYTALLALEREDPTIGIRHALLDVTDDGTFDEQDVSRVLDEMALNLAVQADPSVAIEDFSRFDLNGDGFTRDDTANEMDLNLALPNKGVTYLDDTTVKRLDERFVTDLDVLCFYAWSSRYQGNNDERIALLTGRCRNVVANTTRKLEGTITSTLNRTYSTFAEFGGANGVYPNSSTATLTYNVGCNFITAPNGAGVTPRLCDVKTGQGSGASITSTTTPAVSFTGIGTNCEMKKELFFDFAASASASINDTNNQQQIEFTFNDQANPTIFDLRVNLFGVNAFTTETRTEVFSVLFSNGSIPECVPGTFSENFDGGQVSIGRLSAVKSNIGAMLPGESFTGSQIFTKAFPATVIESAANVHEFNVSWSLQLIETEN